MSLAAELTSAAEELREALDNAGFRALLAAYGFERPNLSMMKLHRNLICSEARTLAQLLCFEEEVDRRSLDNVLPPGTVSRLIENAVLKENEERVSTNGLRLVHHFGALLLCQSRSAAAFAYHGSDSIALGRIIQECRGRVLDCCCGVGAQGIALARQGAVVDGVDLNRKVGELFYINSVLNDVVDSVTFYNKAVSKMTGSDYDWVICNPPLLPVPPELQFPITANGGVDGQDIILDLLGISGCVLKEGGRVRFIGTVLGDKDEPDISLLTQACEESGLSLEIHCPCRIEMRPTEPMFEAMVDTAVQLGASRREAFESMRAHFSQPGRAFLYSMLATGIKSTQRQRRIHISRQYLANSRFWEL